MRIEMKAELPDRVRAMLARVRDLSGLTAYCSGRVSELVRGHLEHEAQGRHFTARRLGAEPTGFLEDAAASVVAAPEPRAVVVRVDSPGVKRAYRDIEIRPKGRFPYLTIPVDAAAYGRRASSLARATGWRMFQFRSRAGNFLLAARGPDGLRPLYALKESVPQGRDPSLMPSDEEVGREIAAGAREYIRRQIAGAAGRATA